MTDEYSGVLFPPNQHYHNLSRLFERNGIIYFGAYDDSHSWIEVVAIDKNTQEEVGKLETSITPDNRKWLDNIFVEPNFRRRRIGENLIEASIILEPHLLIPYNPTQHQFNLFISHCINIGLLEDGRNFERGDELEADDSYYQIMPFSSLGG
jgi:hypothetical protein